MVDAAKLMLGKELWNGHLNTKVSQESFTLCHAGMSPYELTNNKTRRE